LDIFVSEMSNLSRIDKFCLVSDRVKLFPDKK